MRVVFMAYIKGTMEAVDFYCKAFHAQSQNCFKHSDEDDFYAHAEIVINNQAVLAISETAHYDMEFAKGNTMQFWLFFDDEQSLYGAYDILKGKAEIHWALGPGDWCKAVADLTDKYGIRWLLSC